MKKINGYYAKSKLGTTLYQFEWTPTDQLLIILDNGQKTQVDKEFYEIVNIEQITADEPKEKILVLFGNFTFDYFDEIELKLFKENTERKAILHQIYKAVECDTYKDVDKAIFDFEDEFGGAWIAPSIFNGEIIYEPDPKRKDFENLVMSNK